MRRHHHPAAGPHVSGRARSPVRDTGMTRVLTHGTLNGYLNYRCRYQECRDTYAAYQREYRAAR